MPYIDPKIRIEINQGGQPQTAGELNYFITTKILNYLKMCGISYSSINEVIGVLECAKLELYRRSAAQYEDEKISENGDVY